MQKHLPLWQILFSLFTSGVLKAAVWVYLMLLFPFKNKVSIYFNIKNTLLFMSLFFIWLISSDIWPLNQCIVNTSSVYIQWTCYASSCNIYCFASYLHRTTFSHESRTKCSILFIWPLKYVAYLDSNSGSSYLICLSLFLMHCTKL